MGSFSGYGLGEAQWCLLEADAGMVKGKNILPKETPKGQPPRRALQVKNLGHVRVAAVENVRELVGLRQPLLAVEEDDGVAVERHVDAMQLGDALSTEKKQHIAVLARGKHHKSET
jgi:hypothetical protein